MGTPVTWQAPWQGPLADYLMDYAPLIGDRRTAVTFGAVVQGIIGAGSLVCERIAAQSAVLAGAHALERLGGALDSVAILAYYSDTWDFPFLQIIAVTLPHAARRSRLLLRRSRHTDLDLHRKGGCDG